MVFWDNSSTRMKYAGPQNLLGANQPPIVNAGVDQTVAAGAPGDAKRFGQFGPQWDCLSYQWQQVSGPSVHVDERQHRHSLFYGSGELGPRCALKFSTGGIRRSVQQSAGCSQCCRAGSFGVWQYCPLGGGNRLFRKPCKSDRLRPRQLTE